MLETKELLPGMGWHVSYSPGDGAKTEETMCGAILESPLNICLYAAYFFGFKNKRMLPAIHCECSCTACYHTQIYVGSSCITQNKQNAVHWVGDCDGLIDCCVSQPLLANLEYCFHNKKSCMLSNYVIHFYLQVRYFFNLVGGLGV